MNYKSINSYAIRDYSHHTLYLHYRTFYRLRLLAPWCFLYRFILNTDLARILISLDFRLQREKKASLFDFWAWTIPVLVFGGVKVLVVDGRYLRLRRRQSEFLRGSDYQLPLNATQSCLSD